MLRLPMFCCTKYVDRPLTRGLAKRVRSPAGGSTLITSAPRSDSIRVQCGPARTRDRSRTRTPSRGPLTAGHRRSPAGQATMGTPVISSTTSRGRRTFGGRPRPRFSATTRPSIEHLAAPDPVRLLADEGPIEAGTRTGQIEQMARARASSIRSSEKNSRVSEARWSRQRAWRSMATSAASRGATAGRRAPPPACRSVGRRPAGPLRFPRRSVRPAAPCTARWRRPGGR